jgi:hypothetical protein
MTHEEKAALLERTIKQAEQHEEEMRLSYLIAQNRTDCLRQQLQQQRAPVDTQGPDR